MSVKNLSSWFLFSFFYWGSNL